ncbi:MAG: glycosyltransferase family 39 protein [Thermoanaerobaculales bacterium]
MPRRFAPVALILLLGLLPAAFSCHARSFFSPDETSYTEVTLEMMQGGDLLVPHLGGHPWLEKPPLAYWLLAASFALFGFGFPAAVALNTALTLLTAWLVALHAGAEDRRAGMLAAVVYLTMFLPAVAAATALTDPALTLFTTAALVTYLRGGRGSAALSGVFLGLGVLTKGPVAPLVVVPALLAAAAAERRAAGFRRAAVAVGTAAVVTLPWLMVLARRGLVPQLLDEFLGKQVMSRVLEAWAIATPWWYYLPVLWAMAFPWGTHLLVAPVGWRVRALRLRRRDPVFLAEVAAVVTPLVVFSVAHNKLPHYLLPVLPWLACGVGRALAARWDAPPARAARIVGAVAGAVGAAVLTATAWYVSHDWVAHYLPTWTAPALIVGAAAFVLLAALEGTGHRLSAWIGLAGVGVALQLGLATGLVPFAERERVNAAVAAGVRDHLPPQGVPVAYRRWRTAFMTERPLGWRQASNPEDLHAVLASLQSEGQQALVVCRADAEGDVRALAWENGGEARECFRVDGLSEQVFDVTEFVGFEIATQRDGARWFYDFDRALLGEIGLSGVEGDSSVRSFRWANSPEAWLPIAPLPLNRSVLRLQAWATPSGSSPTRLTLQMGPCTLGPVDLGATTQEFSFPLANACLADRPTRLGLQSSKMVRPAESVPGSRDVRLLGAGFDWIAIEPLVATTVLAPPFPVAAP